MIRSLITREKVLGRAEELILFGFSALPINFPPHE
jgi:hypothetical protein